MKVKVVTDSNLTLPEEVIREYDIKVLPLIFIHEGKIYRDGIDITREELYKLLKDSKEPPTTSACSPGTCFEVFRELVKGGNDVLCITIPARFSTMYKSAYVAKDMLEKVIPGKIEVIDSGTALGGQAFLVLEAARMAREGKGIEEIKERIEKIKGKINLLAVLETLKYLAKGGRVPKISALAASIFQIKPIFELKPGGEVKVLGKERNLRKASRRMIDIMGERGERFRVNIAYGENLEEALWMKEEIERRFEIPELYLSPVSNVVSVHTGPRIIILSFYPD